MLSIGIINNMPVPAIRSTERQFSELLATAARDIPLNLRWFRLAGARPSHYGHLDELWDIELDGLIVTGAEPRAASLVDEPFWRPLTRVVEWAAEHTASTIWSCLSAHAVVLYLDGVERCKRDLKIFGIFDTVKLSDHPLLSDVQPIWRVPHSRWNDLPEAALDGRGYQVIARSTDAGVDTFIKHVGRSLFVLFQSHPEYDLGALLREYRRDLTRSLSGGQPSREPRNYFRRAMPDGAPQMVLDRLASAELPESWASTAVQMYRNWLGHLLCNQSAAVI